jgi:hypothetical protein
MRRVAIPRVTVGVMKSPAGLPWQDQPDNAWAVGDSSDTGALTVHWNGKQRSGVRRTQR